LKKLQYIPTLLIFTLFFSCGQNSAEKELNGKWYGIDNDGYTKMHFYPDSLVFTEEFTESVEWNATKSAIDFSLPSNMWLDSIKNVTVNYSLSKKKDTLFGTFINMYGEKKFNLLKADNYIEYLHKRYGIKFSLPKNDSVKYLRDLNSLRIRPIYGLKVFIGYSRDSIIARTELSDNIHNLESDIKTFKERIKPGEHPMNEPKEILSDEHRKLLDSRFHFRVFADKKVSDETITNCLYVNVKGDTSFYNRINIKPPETIPIRIYRIYDNNEMDYNSEVKGKEIKTIANNVYN
jgi:hypothetical protein